MMMFISVSPRLDNDFGGMLINNRLTQFRHGYAAFPNAAATIALQNGWAAREIAFKTISQLTRFARSGERVVQRSVDRVSKRQGGINAGVSRRHPATGRLISRIFALRKEGKKFKSDFPGWANREIAFKKTDAPSGLPLCSTQLPAIYLPR